MAGTYISYNSSLSVSTLQVGSGTAANPAYGFSSQSGFGWYRAGASDMSLAAQGGLQVLSISPAIYSGVVAGASFLSLPKDLSGMIVGLPSASVGAGPIANDSAFIASSDFYGTGISAYAFVNGATSPNVYLKKGRGTAASPLAVQNGDTLGTYQFTGYNGTAMAGGSAGAAQISARASQNFSGSQNGTNLFIATTPDGSTSAADSVAVAGNGDFYLFRGDLLPSTSSNIKFPASGGAKGYMVDNTNAISIDVSGRTLGCTTEDIAASWDNANSQLTITQVGVVQQSPQVQNATTSVGALTKKIQVYNEAGVLLGYIPVYVSIT